MPTRAHAKTPPETPSVAMTPAPHLAHWRARPGAVERYPLTVPSAYRCDTFTDQAAVARLIEVLALKPDDRVLLPVLQFERQFDALIARSCERAIYAVDAQMQVDLADFEAKLIRGAQAAVVSHYFGLPQRAMRAIAALCQRHGAALIEDCTQSMFSSVDGVPTGQFGDYALFSPHRVLPVLEGGLLVSRTELPVDTETREPSLLPTLAHYAERALRADVPEHTGPRWMHSTALHLAARIEATVNALWPGESNPWCVTPTAAEAHSPKPPFSVSAVARAALERANANEIVDARRAHFARWLDCLRHHDRFEPLVDELPDGVNPLYFPVLTDAPESVVTGLAELDIEARSWPRPLLEVAGLTPRPEWDKFARIVALPIHQQLTGACISHVSDNLPGHEGYTDAA
ncbi:MAG: DegT/DnrJ/EryC1/StrS family aminotransferase [Pseudomonadota bacterium]